jgi:hypothetical protein
MAADPTGIFSRQRWHREEIRLMKTVNDKTRITLTILVLLLASCAFGKDDPPLVLHGAIADSQCAFNVHSNSRSHDWMIKRGVYRATDDKSCTLHCVKDMGGNYVLVVKNEVYRLDNQVTSELFAGKKVKVTATMLDAKTHTLQVLKIEDDK